MKRQAECGYNERLFASGPRRWLHLARFRWLRSAIARYRVPTADIVELGCYDGRAIEWLPAPPRAYQGLDANWEGGLELGRARWQETPYRFDMCQTAAELAATVAGRKFDLAIALETLEHVPPTEVEPYIAELAKVTRGYVAVTVPNEKGIVFLAKWLVKRLTGDYQAYTPAELWAAFTGQMHKIERNQHKGFDYRVIARTIDRHFEVLEVSGYPFRALPSVLGFGVGILARARASS